MLIRLRNNFFAGLLVVVPIGITLWIVWGLFNFLDGWFHNALIYFDLLAAVDDFIPPYGLGFIFTVLIICFVGFVTQLYIGRKLLDLVDFLFSKIPGISSIYKGLKQVSEALMVRKKSVFEAVGLVEYPRRGIYSICFIIDTDQNLFSPIVKKDLVYVFLPTTPNPTSGYYLIVPNEDLTPLDISVEEGMKMVISSGMVAPKRINTVDIPIENHIERMKQIHESQEKQEQV
jgi:uncharacterized membrane protein